MDFVIYYDLIKHKIIQLNFIMKNYLLRAFCFGILLTFFACDNINKELVAQIESKTSQYQEIIPDFENTLKGITNLSNTLAAAPEALKSDPVFGAEYATINDKVSSLGMRCNAMKSEYEDLGNKLKVLANDYASGKSKTEAVKTEFETINTGLSELAEGFKKNDDTFGEVSSMYGKMMANFNAKVETK
jgi:uncharacterized phage infection (PIP) family protein YhgE